MKRQKKKDRYYMISLTYEIKKQNKTKNTSETKNRVVIIRGRIRLGKWAKVFKRYKLSVFRLISSGDVIYTVLTIFKSTLLYI